MQRAAPGNPIHSAPHDQTADFVELFFDLVFVFAITRVTQLTAHHLDMVHIIESMLIFWLVWWAWTQFTWTLNSADTSHPEIRSGTLVATAVAFLMATSVDLAFGSDAILFAGPYVVLRILGLGLMIRVTWHDKEGRRAASGFAAVSMIGLAAVLVGAYADPGIRAWWWLATILLDMFATYVGGNMKGWDIRVRHFIERHALIVIIALGESLIVAASAIANVERTPEVLIAGGIALVLTCLLWWSYFGWVREYLEHGMEAHDIAARVLIARDGFSLGHFPLIVGIIGLAVGFESILARPAEPVGPETIAALGVGTALFAGATAFAVWKVSRKVLWPRLVILAFCGGSLCVAVSKPPGVALSIIAAAMTLIVVIEHFKRPNAGESVAEDPEPAKVH